MKTYYYVQHATLSLSTPRVFVFVPCVDIYLEITHIDKTGFSITEKLAISLLTTFCSACENLFSMLNYVHSKRRKILRLGRIHITWQSTTYQPDIKIRSNNMKQKVSNKQQKLIIFYDFFLHFYPKFYIDMLYKFSVLYFNNDTNHLRYYIYTQSL